MLATLATALASDASCAVTIDENGDVVEVRWGDGTSGVSRFLGRVPIHFPGPVAVTLVDEVIKVLGLTDAGMLRTFEKQIGLWYSVDVGRSADFPAPRAVKAIGLSPLGFTAVLACADHTIHVLDTLSGKFWVVATAASAIGAIAMASNSGPIVVALTDGSVCRYELPAGIPELISSGKNAPIAAVTPDGEVVVTVDLDGTLRRHDLRNQNSSELQLSVTGTTAVAMNGAGDRVVLASTTGHLSLHDLADGRRIASVSLPVTPPYPTAIVNKTSESQPVLQQKTTPGSRPAVDDDVRFTVYRPQRISPDRWAWLVVFAHKSEVIDDPVRGTVDPAKKVKDRARAHFGELPIRHSSQDARQGLPKGTLLRVVPDLPGIQCNPEVIELQWWEEFHEAVFRIRAGPELAGRHVYGNVRIWYGPVILGEVSVNLSVGDLGSQLPIGEPVAEPVRQYRKIFPSYSHADSSVVEFFGQWARASGDQFLQDVVNLRAGETWKPRLLEFIDDADVFQLFWSGNSMVSPQCRFEWEHAIKLERPLFVRPLYWEEPLPRGPERNLPPDLEELHFVKVPLGPIHNPPRDDGPGRASPAGLMPRKFGPTAPDRNICEQCGTRNEPGTYFCVSCQSFLTWADAAEDLETDVHAARPPIPRIDSRPRAVPAQAAPPATPSTPARSAPPVASAGRGPLESSGSVRVVIEPTSIDMVPGGDEIGIKVDVFNLSQIVDAYYVSVPNPPTWLTATSGEVRLLPNSNEQTTLELRIAKGQLIQNRVTTLLIRVQSVAHPEIVVDNRLQITVQRADATSAAQVDIPLTALPKPNGESRSRRPGTRILLTLTGGLLMIVGALLAWIIVPPLRGIDVTIQGIYNLSHQIQLHGLPDTAIQPTASAGAAIMIMTIIAMIGLADPKGLLTRLAALITAVIPAVFTAVTVFGITDSARLGPGPFVVIAGCILTFAGGAQARRM